MVSPEWSEAPLAHADELEQAGQCRHPLEGVGNLPRKRSWRLWILTSLVTSLSQPLRKQAPGGRWRREVEGGREIIGVIIRGIIRERLGVTESETVKKE